MVMNLAKQREDFKKNVAAQKVYQPFIVTRPAEPKVEEKPVLSLAAQERLYREGT